MIYYFYKLKFINIMLNEYEEKEQTIIVLFQILFKNFGQNQIQLRHLSDLLNEYDLIVILQEIEPDILFIANMEDFSLLRSDLVKGASEASKKTIQPAKRKSVKFATQNDKFSNFVEILQLLKRFFDNSQTGQMLKKDFNINNLIRVNELLKGSGKEKGLNDSNVSSQSGFNQDLMRLAEVLLVLSALSTRRDDYINILNSLDESEMKYLYDYMNIIENYINFGLEKEDVPNVTRNANAAITRVFRKGPTIRNNILQKEQIHYLKNVESLEKEISQLKTKNEEITNELLDLNIKYRDILRENDILKNNANMSYQLEDSVLITQLRNDLFKKDLEIGDMRRENELMYKRHSSEVERMSVMIENLEQRCEDLKSVKFDNEKLKLKIKEMNINKDKINAFDNLEQSLEAKNKQIENVIKEKQLLFAKTEKLIKENFELKEQLKDAIFQKKKLELDIGDMKKEITHINKRVSRRQTLKSLYKDFSIEGGTNGLDKLQSTFKELISSQMSNKDLNTLIKGNENNLNEILEDTKEECFNLNLALGLEEDLDNLRVELQKANKEIKKQLEENKSLNEEITLLKSDKENLKIEVKQLHSEIDKLIIEKEKLEIAKQKFDLDLQKHLLHQEKLEADKNKLVDEVNELREKVDMHENEKDHLMKEIESLKISLKMKTRQNDKLTEEHKVLVSELENTQSQKTNYPRGSFLDLDLNDSKVNGEQGEGKNMFDFNFAAKLKNEISAKNEQIKQLNEKLRSLEKIEEIYKMKDEKIESDYKFYKKSYDEQKDIVNHEHEVLSNKLCDLAMQFVNFKNELLKNVKPSILNQNNVLFQK